MNSNAQNKISHNSTMRFYEYPDVETCRMIYLHKDIWSRDRLPLLLYCMEAFKNDGRVMVSYKKKKYGRYFAERYSCSNMWGKVRSALFGETEYDVDIKSAHYEILKQMCIDNDIYCKLLIKYCDNREQIIENSTIDEEYLEKFNKKNKKSCSKRDVIKHLFTILLFGGNISTFEKEYGMIDTQYNIDFDVVKLQKEIKSITNEILDLDDYSHIINWLVDDKRTSAKNKYGDKYDENKFKVSNGKKLSYILQEKETNIVLQAIDFFKKNGVNVSSYIYDGFQITKNSCSEDKLNELLDVVNGFNPSITFIAKPFKDALDIDVINSEDFDLDVFNDLTKCDERYKPSCYEAQKYYFENWNFKILHPPSYCTIVRKETYSYKAEAYKSKMKHLKTLTFSDMKKAYMNTSFFERWSSDGDLKLFNELTFRPTGEEYDKTFYHNIWSGFPIEDYELDEEADTSRIYQHFKHISNFDEKVEEYLLNWFAHIIQKPAEKTRVMPILHGKEGTGKSILAEQLLKNIIGQKRITITCKSKQLFGQFANLADKLLIVFNEANAKDTFRYAEDIKDAITQELGNRERKGVDIEEGLKFYGNFISTTNNLNSFKITPTCRRTMPIDVDDSIANDKEYFDALYRDLNDPFIIRKFYEDLLDRDLSNFDCIKDRPMTQLAIAIKCASLDISMQLFLKLEEHINELFHKDGFNGDMIYDIYKSFHSQVGGSIESRKKRQTFLAQLGHMSFCKRKKVNTKSLVAWRYVFDKEKYEQFLEDNKNVIT